MFGRSASSVGRIASRSLQHVAPRPAVLPRFINHRSLASCLRQISTSSQAFSTRHLSLSLPSTSLLSSSSRFHGALSPSFPPHRLFSSESKPDPKKDKKDKDGSSNEKRESFSQERDLKERNKSIAMYMVSWVPSLCGSLSFSPSLYICLPLSCLCIVVCSSFSWIMLLTSLSLSRSRPSLSPTGCRGHVHNRPVLRICPALPPLLSGHRIWWNGTGGTERKTPNSC